MKRATNENPQVLLFKFFKLVISKVLLYIPNFAITAAIQGSSFHIDSKDKWFVDCSRKKIGLRQWPAIKEKIVSLFLNVI